MIYNNIDFFNISDYVTDSNIPGIILQRYPLNIQKTMGYGTSFQGADKAKSIGGAEVRFICDSQNIEFQLYGIETNTYITVFQGDFQNSHLLVKANEINTFTVNKHSRFLEVDTDNANIKRRYTSNLWRIVFDYGAKISFISLNTFEKPYSLPEKKDLPSETYLAYGSSISQGAGAISIHDCYINSFANFYNCDILNKGLSGSCLLEKETIDYLQTIKCDKYLFEIGCNVRGLMDEIEFEKRFDYLIKTTIDNHPTKVINIISILDFFKIKFSIFKNIPYQEKNITFTKIIENIINKYQNGNINLISSNNLLTNLTCISYDMLHPSNYGHLMMGMNLVKYIK